MTALALAALLAGGCGFHDDGGGARRPEATVRTAPAVDRRSPSVAHAPAAHAVVDDPYAAALVHPRREPAAAQQFLNGVALFYDTPQEMLDAVAAYAEANPQLAVIRGYGWRRDAFDGDPAPDDLDDVIHDRPVILLSADLSREWRNSLALGLPLADY